MVSEPHLAHHFADLRTQSHAARLGMWLFLATEILLFGALFVGYATYRTLFHDGFAVASHQLDKAFGTLDTFVLITSSLTMAMSIHWVRVGRRRWSVGALIATIALGLGFLILHGMEYAHDIAEGALPGRLYHVPGAMVPGASMFYTHYFFMTGLHSIHVLAGVTVLGWLTIRTARGAYSAEYDTPLELGGMYWHLVDMIWIFLYPLLYLI